VVTDPLHFALVVADVLERCGLRYLVGGSLASSVSGEPRFTLDVNRTCKSSGWRRRRAVMERSFAMGLGGFQVPRLTPRASDGSTLDVRLGLRADLDLSRRAAHS
jgi:hypothetical protein